MAVYTFHMPQDAVPGDQKALEGAVLVRDGFSWGALIFQLLWCLWNRLWLVSLGVLFVSLVLTFSLEWAGFSEAIVGVAGFLFALWFANEANDLRRLTLERRGLAMRGVVVAANMLEAERRAFSIWLDTDKADKTSAGHMLPAEEAKPVAPTTVSAPHTAFRTGAHDTDVIGLFPPAEEPR
ncbi:DUF2628 domain-containing protein [Pseudochelatococcus sp. G4_1912]|uniref:DUF2628 domain-containing protein n=1 Tax=Pseudochelatococcus sp. G4_1912 TaxID=3114288 RepID=UPI0039C60D04